MLLITCLAMTQQAPRHSGLYTELVGMQMADQEARGLLIADMKSGRQPSPAVISEMARLDRVHARRMREIIAQRGWPTYELVGREGAEAAWLIVQHADHDVDLQVQVLGMMEPLVHQGQASGSNYALLFDRVRVSHGRRQRFGTQFHEVDGALQMQPCEDPSGLDARRRKYGLPPMKLYAQLLESMYGKKVRLGR